MAETILERSSTEMYIEDQAKYAILIDRRRALPMVKDGLKMVQRRIMYAAYKEGMTSPNKIQKSAALNGEIMKNFHPHGDTYSSVVTLAAWYKNKIPLIYGHGNWGNLMGDGAAHMRYTECSLSDFGYHCIMEELDTAKNIVNWVETYRRNDMREPEYLPSKVPILLVNGCAGIGVGMAVNIPPHNLSEVIDATLALLKNPNNNPILIPDTCQACEIIEADWAEINNTGSGKFIIRGVIDTEVDKKGNMSLVVKSLPDDVTTTSVYDRILDLAEKKQLPMVKDVFNILDDEEKPHIIVELKPGADPEFMKQVLYTKCGVQSSVSVNFEAVGLDGIDIHRFSYKEYLLAFIDQRMAIKFRLYCNKLQKAMTSYHYIDAFTRVLESGQIDNIISMIKKSKDTEEQMVEKIIKMCNVTDIQAGFILRANLSKLSLSNLNKYKKDCKELRENIDAWTAIVTDESGAYLKSEIETELKEIKKKYGTPRLCRVISKEEGSNIPRGIFKIVITERNFIRKIPDVDNVGIVRKDNPKFILRVDNIDNLLLFDNKGKVFSLPVSKIPISDRTHAGTDVRMLIRNLTADIIAVYSEPIFKKISKSTNKHFLTVLTKSNTIKKLDIDDFLSVSPSGLIYSKIRPDDEVVDVSLVAHNLDVVICSNTKALRIKCSDIPLVKRNAIGSKAMDTSAPIEGMTVIYPDSNYIIGVTERGKFNKFDINMFQCHARARKGSNVLKLDPTDKIFGVYAANDSDHIRVITSEGVEEVDVSSIKTKSPVAAGMKMVKTKGVIIKANVVR